MTKIVYNDVFGGFNLSEEATELLTKYKNLSTKITPREIRNLKRHDKDLVKVVEKLKNKASGSFSSLKIRKVEKGKRYYITEYDGNESVVTEDEFNWETAD